MAIGDAHVFLGFLTQQNLLAKATNYFSHMHPREEEKIRQKEDLAQSGIELTTTR